MQRRSCFHHWAATSMPCVRTCTQHITCAHNTCHTHATRPQVPYSSVKLVCFELAAAAWAAAKGTTVEPASELLWRDQLRAAYLSAVPGRVDQVAQQLTETLEPIGGDMDPETVDLLTDAFIVGASRFQAECSGTGLMCENHRGAIVAGHCRVALDDLAIISCPKKRPGTCVPILR